MEREVARLREQAVVISSEAAAARADAAAARVLAGGADRNVLEVRAELRVHIQTRNALRETQLEQAQEMAEMRKDLDETRAEMREGSAEMREDFAKQATGMTQITALLTHRAAGPDTPGRRARHAGLRQVFRDSVADRSSAEFA